MTKGQKVRAEHDGTIVVGLKDASCISPYTVLKAPDGDQLYTTMMHSGNVAVLDRASLMLQKVIPLPGGGTSLWAEAAIEPQSKNMFISSYNQDRLYVVDTSTDTARLMEGEWAAPGKIVDAGDGGVWLAHGGKNEIVRLDGKTGKVTASIGVDPWPIALAIDHEKGLAYVACQHENLSRAQMLVDPLPFPDGTLCIVDLKARDVTNRIPLGRRPSGVALDVERGLVFVSEMADNNIAVIETRAGEVVDRINVKCSPYGIEYEPADNLVYVLCIYGDSFDTEGQPSPVAVIDPEKREVLRYLEPGKMAHQLTVDSEHGVVYVGAEDTCDVRAVNTVTGETVATTSMIGFTVDGLEPFGEIDRLFIPSHFTESCLVVDTSTNKLAGDLHCGGWVSGAVGSAVPP